VHAGWNLIKLNTVTTDYAYYRITGSKAGACLMAEFTLYGTEFIQNNADTQQCPVDVTVNGVSQTVANAVTYKASVTPTITSVTPQYGTFQGGTAITIAGTGFAAGTTVTIDGIACGSVSVVSATSITCTTGARSGFVKPTLEVNVPNKGFAMTKGIVFTYTYLWSDKASWNGQLPPGDGDSITVPKDQVIVFDIAKGPKLKLVLLDGGHLLFFPKTGCSCGAQAPDVVTFDAT